MKEAGNIYKPRPELAEKYTKGKGLKPKVSVEGRSRIGQLIKLNVLKN
jgi:hypothetical protein